MNVTVDAIRIVDGTLQVWKLGGWRCQTCMFTSREGGFTYCGAHCPLFNVEPDGCVILCQDRMLLPRRVEAEAEGK